MALAHLAKPIIREILHLKKCKAEDPEQCSECVVAATHLAGVLSEVVEVADVVRRWHHDIQSAMRTFPAGGAPSTGRASR